MAFLHNPIVKWISDKVGLSTDNWVTNKTVLGYSNTSYQHVHNSALCHPTLAQGVQVSSGAQAWQLGSLTEIIPSNTITHAYDIHWINFESASTNGVYELHLFRGIAGQESLIARVRTTRDSNVAGVANVPVQVPILSSNERITARLASDGGNRNVVVSVYYHAYEN